MLRSAQEAGRPVIAVENGIGLQPTLLFVKFRLNSEVVVLSQSVTTIGVTASVGGRYVQAFGVGDGDGKQAATTILLVAVRTVDRALFTLNAGPCRMPDSWPPGIVTPRASDAV